MISNDKTNINVFGFMDGDGGNTMLDNIVLNYFSPKLPSGLYLQIYLDGLMRCFGDNDQQFSSNQTIANKYGISDRSVAEIWSWWEQLGLVKRVPRYCKVRCPKTKAEHLDYKEVPDAEYKFQCANAIKFLKNIKLAIAEGRYNLEAALQKQDVMLLEIKEKNILKKSKNKKLPDSVSAGIEVNEKSVEAPEKEEVSTEGGDEACTTPRGEACFRGRGEAQQPPRGEACFTQINTYNNKYNNITTTDSKSNVVVEVLESNMHSGALPTEDSPGNQEENKIQNLLEIFQTKTGAKFDIQRLKELIALKGIDTVEMYFSNADRFPANDPARMLYKAIKESYPIPPDTHKNTRWQTLIPQHTNFTQRVYSDEEYESFYTNLCE